MKRVFVAFLSIVISINAISQDIKYRKDERPQNIKDDWLGEYQANSISVLDILMALEIAGIKIFSVPISPAFEKEYNFSVNLSEYIDSKKINSQNIILTPGGKNVYRHSDPAEFVFDYIPKLTFFTKDDDTTMSITTKYYGGSTRRHLKMNKVRDRQFYRWRAYSKTDWKLNEEVPLLVYASSWYDERIKSERFCGTVDLSLDEEETKKLLDNSQHYYVISLKVFE
jgi:hypothetical protein